VLRRRAGGSGRSELSGGDAQPHQCPAGAPGRKPRRRCCLTAARPTYTHGRDSVPAFGLRGGRSLSGGGRFGPLPSPDSGGRVRRTRFSQAAAGAKAHPWAGVSTERAISEGAERLGSLRRAGRVAPWVSYAWGSRRRGSRCSGCYSIVGARRGRVPEFEPVYSTSPTSTSSGATRTGRRSAAGSGSAAGLPDVDVLNAWVDPGAGAARLGTQSDLRKAGESDPRPLAFSTSATSSCATSRCGASRAQLGGWTIRTAEQGDRELRGCATLGGRMKPTRARLIASAISGRHPGAEARAPSEKVSVPLAPACPSALLDLLQRLLRAAPRAHRREFEELLQVDLVPSCHPSAA